MPGHTGEPEGNVWGAPAAYTAEEIAALDEPDTENDENGGGEPNDPSSTNSRQVAAGAQAPAAAVSPPTVAEQMAAWMNEQSDKFAAGDTQSVLYKPFQQVVSKKDQEIASLRRDQSAMAAQVAELLETLGELGDGVNILSEHTMEALPDEIVGKLKNSLLAQQAKNANTRLQKARAPQPPPVPAAPDATTSPAGVDIREVIAKANSDFVASRQAAARKAGVDPSKVELDYGDPSEGVVGRLAKFEDSLEAAIKASEEKSIDSVRQRTHVAGTRSGSGAAPSARSNGSSLLEQGSRERTGAARAAGWFA